LGPFSYVLAHEVAGVESLVVPGSADGTPSTYHSLIHANAATGIASLEELPGHSFAFVDPASASGHLIPRAMLVSAGIDPEQDLEMIFAGGHDASLLAIAGGRVDAGASSDGQFREMVQAGVIDEANFVTLARSEPIPSSPLTTRGDLDPALRERLLQALLRFHEEVPPEVAAGVLGEDRDRYVEAPDSLYDPIREVAEVLDLETLPE